jgi:hypothetical protein
MFEKDYTIHGIHATYIKYLVNDAKIFERYIDVYMTAAAMGCLYDKRSVESSSTDRARIYADAFSTERDKCMELFRTLILADASKPWSAEERTNICFKYRDEKIDNAVPMITDEEVSIMKEAMELFNSYVRGGIEILYENFYSPTINLDDAIDYAYKTVFDQNSLIESRQGDLDVGQLLRPEY